MLESFSADINHLPDRNVKPPGVNIWMRLTSSRISARRLKSASLPPLTTSIDFTAACYAAVRLPPCPAAHGRLTGRRFCAIIIKIHEGRFFYVYPFCFYLFSAFISSSLGCCSNSFYKKMGFFFCFRASCSSLPSFYFSSYYSLFYFCRYICFSLCTFRNSFR